jgi:hypothetical protein
MIDTDINSDNDSGGSQIQWRDLPHQREKNRFLGVQAVFGLLEHNGMRRIDDRIRNLLPAVRRETVHENVVRLRVGRE